MSKFSNLLRLSLLGFACTYALQLQAQSSATNQAVQISRSEKFSEVAPVLAQADSRTLVAFDIDDTLLTADSFFGSDHWYEWQKSLNKTDSAYVPCKFDVIAINFELGAMHATEAEAVSLVNGLKSDKLYLTARNPGYRSATERELKRAGYQLPAMLNTNADGISFKHSDAEQNRSADVSYQNGIYMVNGLGKGEALIELLRRLNKQYDKVILVDDGRKNIDSLAQALSKRKIAYHGFHYLQIGKALPPQQELVVSAQKSWQNLREYLRNYSPARLQQIENAQCAY